MNATPKLPPRTLSYCHRGGETPLLWNTIDQRFRYMVEQQGGLEALVSIPQNRRLSYQELHDEVEVVARALVGMGVERGDHVGIWATNNIEWVLIQLATARIGVVLVNVNPAYQSSELEHAMKLARITTLVLMPAFRRSAYAEMVHELCPEVAEGTPAEFKSKALPLLERVIVFDPDQPMETARPYSAMWTWQEFLGFAEGIESSQLEEIAHDISRDDAVNIQFTSGTTGFPKAVVLTHHNIVNNAYFTGIAMKLAPGEKLCVPLPFYHCFGMVVSNLACFSHGATIVIPSPHFDVEAALRAIESERCTAIHGVPTMFVAKLEARIALNIDTSSLRTGIMAGAPCPPEVVRKVMEDLGCREILIGYGQTEASPLTHLTMPDDSFDRRVNSVGTNLPHQECKIVDPIDNRVLPIGEPGEVCFRGYHVMKGYYNDEKATDAAIDDSNWLHSGDLGVMDEDGYVKITGRLKEMIIRGGENIYPAEIEAFYHRHDAVGEVAVFGIDDDKLGEEVGMWVKPTEGMTVDGEELRAWAKGKIAHYKIPCRVWLVDEFPMTVTGKIRKLEIREIVKSWLDKEREEPAGAR